MSRGLNLYKKHLLKELVAMRESIEADPLNKNTERDSIYLYTPKARKKLEDLAWAVRYHLDDKKDTQP